MSKRKKTTKRANARKPAQRSVVEPVLRFSPTAWAKLLAMRDQGECEVGGFGVCATDDLLFVTDFVTVRQDVSIASVAFEDEAVADFFEDQIERGLRPAQFARIWMHSHPGDCPEPSGTDEECFDRVFGQCDWAVMFIVARGGATFARLQHNTGPGGRIDLAVEVDYSAEFTGSNHGAWREEYARNVRVLAPARTFGTRRWDFDVDDLDLPEPWIEDLELMEPEEREAVLADLWD